LLWSWGSPFSASFILRLRFLAVRRSGRFSASFVLRLWFLAARPSGRFSAAFVLGSRFLSARRSGRFSALFYSEVAVPRFQLGRTLSTTSSVPDSPQVQYILIYPLCFPPNPFLIYPKYLPRDASLLSSYFTTKFEFLQPLSRVKMIFLSFSCLFSNKVSNGLFAVAPICVISTIPASICHICMNLGCVLPRHLSWVADPASCHRVPGKPEEGGRKLPPN